MTDLPELIEDEEQDRSAESYATPQAPYADVLDDKALRRLRAYREATELVDRGVEKAGQGALDQVNGLYKIWKHNLWKAEGRFNSQNDWLDDYLIYHRVTVVDTKQGIGRTTFFLIMKAVSKGLALGLEYEDALRLGLNHGAVEELEKSGAVSFTPINRRNGGYVPVITPAGEQKLLKGGLITPPQYFTTIANASGKDAMAIVRTDIGRKYTYCAFLQQYRGGTPLFNEDNAKVFAAEFRHVDPDNGETPYQCKVVFPDDVPDSIIKEILRKWKADA